MEGIELGVPRAGVGVRLQTVAVQLCARHAVMGRLFRAIFWSLHEHSEK